MEIKFSRKVFAGLSSLILAFSCIAGAYSASSTVVKNPESVIDDETVYALLTPSGSTKKVVVVDWLRAEGKGNLLVEDVKPEGKVEVLKNTPDPEIKNGMLLFEVKADSFKDVFYQTETNKELPLDIKVEYKLNGKIIRPEEIAGKSGKLEVKITIKNKLKKNVKIEYEEVSGARIRKTREIYTPLFVVASLNLDSEKFNNIKVNSGWLSAQGSKFALNWFAFPQGEAEIGFEADARNIEIPSIVLSAMPRLPQEVSIEMKDEFKQLYEGLSGLSKLSDAQAMILSTSASKIDTSRFSSLTQATQGFAKITNGLNQSSNGLNNLSLLVSAQIQVLDSMIKSLESGNFDNVQTLITGLSQIKGGIDSVSAALSQLGVVLNIHQGLAEQALELNGLALEKINQISPDATSQAEFDELKGILVNQQNLLKTLVSGGEIQPGQSIPSLGSINSSIAQIENNLTLISNQLGIIIQNSNQLASLPENLEQLESSLRSLRDGGYFMGQYLPGLKSVKDGLNLSSKSLNLMSEGISNAASKFKLLESLPDSLIQLRTALITVAKGGYIKGKKLPGISEASLILKNMADGISAGYSSASEGEAYQKALKEESTRYDTFLGRSKKKGYSGRVRFILKLEEVKK
ncbi:MAG: hypothetical protein N2440_04975 [Actinobacteria bacterium]|nr:hypothetical protein [Actinomycetota bacterium]